MIQQTDIDRILDATDLVNLINQYGRLRKAGVQFNMLCPFHKERGPSFYVHPAKQLFHCKGCGAGGNAINFIERIEHLSFPAAVRLLADRAGIELSTGMSHLAANWGNMIAAEAHWYWRKVLAAYRNRETRQWRFFHLVYAAPEVAFNTHALRYWKMSEAVRCRRSAYRWQRIIARLEARDSKFLFEKYYAYRLAHPEIVRIYREERDLLAACQVVEAKALMRIAEIDEQKFYGLIRLIGERVA